MSAQTKAALDEALAAHIADEAEGAIVTSYVLQASMQTLAQLDAETTGYFHEFGNGQGVHVCLGLAHMLVRDLTTAVDGD